MTPPSQKKAKQRHDEGDDDDEEEEKLIITACQVLRGDWDRSLPPHNDDNNNTNENDGSGSSIGVRRARLVRNLLVGDNDHQNHNRIQKSMWSLDMTRSTLNVIGKQGAYGNARNGNDTKRRFATLMGAMNARETTTTYWKIFKAPILSLAHVEIANAHVDDSLSRNKNNSAMQSQSRPTNDEIALRQILMALQYWPCNPGALICLANMKRMGMAHRSTIEDKDRLFQALQFYLAAAKCAFLVHELSTALLRDPNIQTDDKFLIESILLESAQVDELENDGNDTSSHFGPSQFLVTASCVSAILASMLGHHAIAKCILERFATPTKSDGRGVDDCDDDDDDGDENIQLSSSDGHVTRIHPAVWDAAMAILSNTHQMNRQVISNSSTSSTPVAVTPTTQAAFSPTVFPNTVPHDLFCVLRNAFRPEALYWQQSGYDRNVYYSFWTDWPLPRPKDVTPADATSNAYMASNAVEHYIVEYLLPRIKSISKDHDLDQLKGFEWWVHTRPHGANLGHQLHFDTDEALLEQDGIIQFPLSASVTYLTLDDISHGPTILFDQTPRATENAQTAWINNPKSRSFLIFPGDLLHGVLPCMTHNNRNRKGNNCSRGDPMKESVQQASVSDHIDTQHRLTFMVNFWSYRIPDRLKKRKLYGPSGPFPPNTRKHSWIQDICESYPRTIYMPIDPIFPPNDNGLLVVHPAWERLCSNANGCEAQCDSMTPHDDDDYADNGGGDDAAIGPDVLDTVWAISRNVFNSPLIFPASGSGINQRFFVTNAPQFFQSTLYEK